MAQTTGQNLPVPQSPFVVPQTGVLSNDGYQFLLGLLNETASAQATATVANSLTAKGTNQATALQLSSIWNQVTTTPANSGVLLSSYQPGQSQTVFNQGDNPLNVYPPPGAQIDNQAVNAPFVLSAGSRATFDFLSSALISS